jgi:uncharacterized protein
VRVAQVRKADGAIVCERCALASTPWARFAGLQLRKELPGGEGMLFPDTGSIHMFFMRFAIDAVFCDRELRVLKIVRGLKPWRMAAARGAKVVIELPVGAAAGLEPGDRLVLED